MNLNYSLQSFLLLQFTDMNKNTLIKSIIKAENKLEPKYQTELCKKFKTQNNALTATNIALLIEKKN